MHRHERYSGVVGGGSVPGVMGMGTVRTLRVPCDHPPGHCLAHCDTALLCLAHCDTALLCLATVNTVNDCLATVNTVNDCLANVMTQPGLLVTQPGLLMTQPGLVARGSRGLGIHVHCVCG